jgi:predicted  nucleic acid-binding Zn-ribbon protein
VERKFASSLIVALAGRGMTRVGSAFLATLFFLLLTVPLSAQEDDPSDIFLKAYLSAQQGEKLEHENRFKAALAKYRFAGSLIEELRRSHSDWQPAIVDYRGRKIGEGILRVQERISKHNELSAAASPLPEVVPSLPENEAWSEPGAEIVAPQGLDTISQGSSDGAIEEATRKLRRKVDQLQAALEKSRSDLETARKEKAAVNTHLQETSSKLENAQKEIETSKESERQARDQLAETQVSFKAPQSSQENSTIEQLRTEIADLKDAVAVSEEARATAERQRDETNAKLADTNKQITAVEQQRDEALAQLKAGSETEQQTQALLAENGDLKLKLANLEKNVPASDNSTNVEELVGVKQEVTQLQQQLAESQKQNQYLVARIAEIWVQLDEAGAQLQSAKLAGKNSEETDRLMRENELLRNIVVREREEEARRDEARKLMLAELDRLRIKSASLNKEIEILAQPVTKLSSEELSLLRQPVVSVSDQNRGVLTASFIFAKKSAGDSVEGEATTNNSGGVKGDAGDVPHSVVHAAKESFSGASTEPQKPMSGSPDQGSE